MLRSLEEIANATPQDYANYFPKEPVALAHQMFDRAGKLFPRRSDMEDANYRFLYVGPGAGFLVQELIDLGHQAKGVETSRKGISLSPQGVWSYIMWSVPWELSLESKSVDIALISRYYETLLSPEEWSNTVTEIIRISKDQSII